MHSPAALVLAVLLATSAPAQPAATPPLMPLPAESHPGTGHLALTAAFSLAVHGQDDARLRAAIARALLRVEARTSLAFGRTANGEFALAADPGTASLVIECAAAGPAIPSLEQDESYTLAVAQTQAILRAPTVVGALRGLETWQQLLQADGAGWFWPAIAIADHPRFTWRGLLIDVGRHWEPLEVIERNLDGMAVVKLNVLHFHLTEDQGFRIESKKYPRLHQLGSDGHYFTQAQIRELVAYAAARGIRIVPEFDLPGHTTSWAVAYPELASAPGPYELKRRWGVHDPVLDPTNEALYALLDGFLGEMAGLFPDAYLHIGGDENNGKQWSANPKIQAFIRSHGLKDNAGLQAYFNRRVRDILARHGKHLVGWDEILHPDLPKDAVVQSWRGADALAAIAHQGFAAILSHGYYLDHMQTAAEHYADDPVPATSTLSPADRKRVLGGEACMWGEWVTPETIDSRIWPRTAAIAERLWSPPEVTDTADMYRRLALISRRLEEAGLRHETGPAAMLRRLAGDGADPAEQQVLHTFAGLVEPVDLHHRILQSPGITQFVPLTGLADCTLADSAAARAFTEQVKAYLFSPGGRTPAQAELLRRWLQAWQAVGREVATVLAVQAPALREAAPVAQALSDASGVGLDALRARAGSEPRLTPRLTVIAAAAANHAGVNLAVLPPLRLLAAAADAGSPADGETPASWRTRVEKLAAAPPAP